MKKKIVNHIFGKGFIYSLYKRLLQLSGEKNQTIQIIK